VNVTQGIDGAYRIGLTFSLLLMKLHFVGLQPTVTLLHIDATGKHGIVRIIAFRMVSIDGDRQIIGFAGHQRAVVAWDAQLTLRGKIGRLPILTVQGCADHRGQKGGNTFFHTLYLLFRHQWLFGM